MSSRYPLSIVIPVYNEERVLPALLVELELVREGLLKSHGSVEIVLVNDDSQPLFVIQEIQRAESETTAPNSTH